MARDIRESVLAWIGLLHKVSVVAYAMINKICTYSLT